ncbi:immunodominant staphylococcal antigen IsaB family protein [Staphylococcus equorum]|uniref:immunodominant staphylococcal antigen IsaB family protein n=1 Tax=Staphylococcus equorum TaxID=246432 RepID=UPI003EC100DC
MNKVVKLLSSTVIVSTLVVGSSAAYITSNNQEVKAQSEQVQKWGHGEGGASGANTESSASGVELKAETPWYNYEGYTTYDASFTQDYNFVRALKYDNVSINGYKVDTEAEGDYDHQKDIYDTSVGFNSDDEVVQIHFMTKQNAVTEEAFKKAHASNEITEEGKLGNDDGTFLRYATNDGSYYAAFDHNGYLTQMTIE